MRMEQERIHESEAKYIKERELADNLLARSKVLSNMTIAELKTIAKPLRRKNEGAMPTKKRDLLQCIEKWKNRTPPNFDIVVTNTGNEEEPQVKNETDEEEDLLCIRLL